MITTVREWVATITAIIGLIGAVATPFIWLVKKYKKDLDEIMNGVRTQAEINRLQAEQIAAQADQIAKNTKCIHEINLALKSNAEEHSTLIHELEGIKAGLLVIIQIELDKILCRCITREYCTIREKEQADLLFAAYEALGGNHGMKGRKKTFDGLAVKELERVG